MIVNQLLRAVNDIDPVPAVIAVAVALLFVWNLLLSVRLRRFSVKYRNLLSVSSTTDLEETLGRYMSASQDANDRSLRFGEVLETLDAAQQGAFTRRAIVRYDAFNDVGGKMSFSLALLDAKGDGILLTTVHGRDGCRIYAKEIQQGASPTALSDEERDAVSRAMSNSRPLLKGVR